LVGSRREEPYGVARELREQCRSVLETLKSYHDAFRSSLPEGARECVERFLGGRGAQFIATLEQGTDRETIAMSSVMFLSAFETEMSFLLSNQQERVRVRSERAFLHLQWLLAVDADLRARWDASYHGKGEVSCEQLGAAHLLWHGIFAFKAHTPQARTDLVFNEPIEGDAGGAVEGFVLTEWKTATPQDAREKFAALRVQLEAYEGGPLGGTELTGYRYGVVVTERQLPRDSVPEEPVINGIRLRYVNVAINPRPPAEESRYQGAAARRAQRMKR
jgi:hypothetical protein